MTLNKLATNAIKYGAQSSEVTDRLVIWYSPSDSLYEPADIGLSRDSLVLGSAVQLRQR
ncbi:hypothetical protein HFO89_31645 [Rhizobium leguminosarum]|uniref:hypothetical protein n=1 Tax=Rhizobium leguminosarum TaxID=384 RepID=UPI001C94F26D|nr:hypothetical protein [Rhizobium leguminosarum]MBY5460826.1 hypothetical protein [Rhizobium leguminosarum]